MKDKSGRISTLVPLWKTVCALMLSLGVLSNADASALRLLPGVELATPRLMPGTVMQAPATDTPASKVNAWQGGLHIDILKGDRGVNIIKKKTAVTPVVEVKDRNNLPVAGVIVIFSSPPDGPSVTFLNGSRSYSAITDAQGQATASPVKPLNTGNFQIRVSTSHQGEIATAVIAMTNVLSAADATGSNGGTGATSGGGGLSHTAIGILVGVAAAAAVGVAVGVAGHGSSSASSTSTTATIGVGTGGTVGAPH